MGSMAETEYRPDTVSTPGEILEELLEERGMTQAELARRTGRPTKTINEIIKGKSALTTETALQLEKVFGVPARFWNNLERGYREHIAREKESKRLASQIGWLRKFPIKAMFKHGWIEKKSNDIDQMGELLTFFGVTSVASWNTLLTEAKAAFRRSSSFEYDTAAIAAWLRQGEREAQAIDCREFDPSRLKKILEEIRPLTIEPPEVFQGQMRERCSEAGVAVVFVPEMPKSRVSGATRWLTPQKALVQLSLRYKTDDHFWFTFFHECGHLIKHGKRAIFLEAADRVGDYEAEADHFAETFLIPQDDYREFVESGRWTCGEIRQFAQRIGIAPGIVVGRLQHDGRIGYEQCNGLKRRLAWAE